MVISSEFRTREYWDDDYLEDAPHFIKPITLVNPFDWRYKPKVNLVEFQSDEILFSIRINMFPFYQF